MSDELLHRVRTLLSDHVNKSLSADDQAFMNHWLRDHLDQHPALQDELRWLTLTREQLRQSVPAVDPEAGWHELLARIEAAPRPASASTGVASPASPWEAFLAWWSRPALAMAMTLVVLMQSAALWWLWPSAGGEVRPMSSPTSTITGQVVLQLVFQDQASVAQVRAALVQVQAQVVDGPGALGVWRVAVPARAASQALATLRAHPSVEQVEVAP